MKVIVAVDSDWGIGYRGKLLQRIPEDMKFFKQMTLGKVVIMGRETFESLPGKQPLKDRINIVLSKHKCFDNKKVTICHSLNELFFELEKYNNDDIFVIGGESIYSQLLPFCTEAYVTKIESKYVADKYFVDLDRSESWTPVTASSPHIYQDIYYRFLKYIKNK
ncbi:MAG: dihydrofolate reductase [Syntrophomonadaceae bacterium]|nr:dihydrofolate reductase [Syntrophomonadaceae bacterium]MDD4549334.1 dihydrofolate reductase [Syntrophomonadaceae bacterium]